jgi:dTDP-4-dehydrorhamnose reductase
MILVFGENGQVATALKESLPEATFVGSKAANFLNPERVLETLNTHKPTVVINAAAYTQVDKAEDEKEAALTINATTPGAIAEWCKNNKALLVHYSTDYVFDGSGDKPWTESDQPNPVNYYGYSKWQGEKAILASHATAFIFRISWVYSPWGNNFKKTMLKLAKEREQLSVVNDQWGAPTSAEDVAQITTTLVHQYLKNEPIPEPGIYHLRFEQYQTWYQFASNIIQAAKEAGESIKVQEIRPVTSAEFPTKAKRPANSRLGSNFPLDLWKIKASKAIKD